MNEYTLAKRVVIYARVSTEGQAEEGFSIDAQVGAIKERCKLEGKEVVKEYIDRGISGKSMENRPQLLKMLEDAKKGLFDEIMVWKINRLARNNSDLLRIYEKLERAGVAFKSLTEPFDTSSAVGKLLFSMLGSIGEFERETIVDNVKTGMRQRAKQGYSNGGRTLGYRSVAVEDEREKSKLVIDLKEAEIVRVIFKLYSQGKGYKYIANYLNKLGYTTVRGNRFCIQNVRAILLNPIYIGKVRFNHYVNHSKKKRRGNENEFVLVQGHHEPIIEKELWDKVQTLFQKRQGRPQKNFSCITNRFSEMSTMWYVYGFIKSIKKR